MGTWRARGHVSLRRCGNVSRIQPGGYRISRKGHRYLRQYHDALSLGPGDYKILFIVRDNSCISANSDTLSVEFSVIDKETTLANLIPPNLITPNADSLNDYFEIIDMPADNCVYYFKAISIFNRWGGKVYESHRRDFRWDPSEFSEGIYYYSIDLNAKKIKGWVQVIGAKE